MERIEFLKGKKEMCETSIEHCKDRIKLMENELSVINEMLSEIERQQGSTDTAL